VRLPVVLAVGVVIVVVAVLAIRVASGAPETAAKPRALVLGDSITDQAQKELNDELGPIYTLSIEGQDNFRLDQQIPAAERWATRPFQQVVINLGTNDAVQGWPTNQSVASLERLVSLYPSARCIHLTTVNERIKSRSRSADGPTRARAINNAIHALAEVDSRIRIVDWNALMKHSIGTDVELTTDGVHPNEPGQQLLIDGYENSMAKC
jgi:lysophospholipase L1-like esterase